jgi:hypothetical protein
MEETRFKYSEQSPEVEVQVFCSMDFNGQHLQLPYKNLMINYL